MDLLSHLSDQEMKNYKADIAHRLQHSLAQLKNPFIFYTSTLRKINFTPVFNKIFSLEETWSKRISTSRLNDWVHAVQEVHQPPLVNGKRLKIRYLTQIKTRPPSFVLFCNKPEDLPDSYIRFMEGHLRKTFNLNGIPIRFSLKKGNNPYVKS